MVGRKVARRGDSRFSLFSILGFGRVRRKCEFARAGGWWLSGRRMVEAGADVAGRARVAELDCREGVAFEDMDDSGWPYRPRFHVVLAWPEIAANTGAIGRTCVAAGAMLWLVRPLGFHLGDRHRRRAGLDYWEDLLWTAVDSMETIAARFGPDRLWSFTTRGGLDYTEAVYREGDALVFGPESRGLPSSWLDRFPDRNVRIGMRAEARSLNLSNAAAIGLYEAIRQTGGIRGFGGSGGG